MCTLILQLSIFGNLDSKTEIEKKPEWKAFGFCFVNLSVFTADDIVYQDILLFFLKFRDLKDNRVDSMRFILL